MTGRNHHWLVGVTGVFGLLCLTQAALNIYLRLYVYKTTVNDGAQLKNVTEERDEFKRKLIDVEKNTLGAQLKNVTEERDELRRNMIEFVTSTYTQSGWQYFEGSVYYVSNTQKTWKQSREDCLQRGADLMIINSREEQGFTRKLKDNMWIGLTDRETEGTWKWVDGTPLITRISYWMNGQPNNLDNREDCGEVRWHQLENSWNDKPCDYEQFWICEKKMPLLLSLQP